MCMRAGMLAGMLAGVPAGVAIAASSADERPVLVSGDDAGQTERIREGTEIVDRMGHFQITGERVTGERVTFVAADGDGRFVALENLSLQRVVRAITDSPEPLKWSVSGTATEFNGANYLLIQRAVLKSQVPSTGGAF